MHKPAVFMAKDDKPGTITMRLNWESEDPEEISVRRFVQYCEEEHYNRSGKLKEVIHSWVKTEKIYIVSDDDEEDDDLPRV